MSVYSSWGAVICTLVVLALVSTRPYRSADLPPNPGRSRLLALDGVRGFAAFGVFLHHAMITHDFYALGVWQLPPARFYSVAGQVGVDVFFMITGYLFWSMMIREEGRPQWIALYVGRVFRIGPVFTLAMVLMAAITVYRTGFSLQVPLDRLVQEIGQWMSIGILLGGTLNGYDQTSLIMAGVTWTLQYEWAFYASLTLMPIGALDRNAVLPFAAVVMAASLWWWHEGGPFFLAANDAIMAILLSIGMAAAALESKGLMLRRVPDIGLSAAILALVVLLFVLFPNGYGLAPIACLGVAFYLVVSGGTVFGLLTSRPARRLGDVSYGVYLLQGPVLTLVFAPKAVRDFALSGAVAYWSIVTVAAICLVSLATVAHDLLERPGIRAGKSLVAAMRASRILRLPLGAGRDRPAGRVGLAPGPVDA